ncbi:hypothetical protein KW801_03090 [Candidatus Saccharibacteria bacterium]|nr:hypothetical protein [Candidatus Saccharibacteria bacterium]
MSGKQKHGALKGSVDVIKDSLKVVRQHPEIALYPYAATLFISITYPLVSATILAHWYRRIFADTGVYVPDRARLILGLVGFSAFYVALVTAYFTTAVSASVLAKLEDRPTPPFYGLLRVAKNFIKVTKYAFLSLFFFPIGVFAQRSKLPRGIVGVVGGSVTLHMAQVAPSFLTTNMNLGSTIRHSVDTLGRAWREGLILKIGTYIAIFLVIALPKLIQHGFFKSHKASNIGWLVSLELAASSYVVLKVINAIFTTVLYHKARQLKK